MESPALQGSVMLNYVTMVAGQKNCHITLCQIKVATVHQVFLVFLSMSISFTFTAEFPFLGLHN